MNKNNLFDKEKRKILNKLFHQYEVIIINATYQLCNDVDQLNKTNKDNLIFLI